MDITVVKYGGSLLTDGESIPRIVNHIEGIRRKGEGLVVVVSALKNTTDHLYNEAFRMTHNPDPRDLDSLLATGEMVSSASVAMGLVGGVAMNAYDARIHGRGEYGDGYIDRVDVSGILEVLSNGRVPVVCGYQAVSPEGGLMTLGRGGSDLTAVALGRYLNAHNITIYKDVPGVLPYPGASEPYSCVDYSDLATIQTQFSRPLIQLKALNYAMKHNISIRIESPMRPSLGTDVREHKALPLLA